MVNSLESPDWEYTRADVLAWQNLESSECQVIDDAVGISFGTLARKSDQRPLVVDCEGVYRLADHALDAEVPGTGQKARDALASSERSVVFCIPLNLQEQFQNALVERPLVVFTNDEEALLLYGRDDDMTKPQAVSLATGARSLVAEHVNQWVAECWEEWPEPRRLFSTPLLANGFFDSRRILSDTTRFVWTCSALANAIRRLLPDDGNQGFGSFRGNLGLLAVSLKSAALAAGAAALLGDYFLRTLSVMTPFDVHPVRPGWWSGERPADDLDFILVADFVIGGSELRVAEALAHVRTRKLRGAICLGAALPLHEYACACEIESVVSLPRGLAKYSF